VRARWDGRREVQDGDVRTKQVAPDQALERSPRAYVAIRSQCAARTTLVMRTTIYLPTAPYSETLMPPG
jgi:hypothetical protein